MAGAVNDPKPFASLSATLLARKGAALPSANHDSELDGGTVVVHRLQECVAAAFAPVDRITPSRHRRSAPENGNRAAFTLRLDEERHLRLRLASTLAGQSAQQVVTEALDRFLADFPEIDALAGEMRRARRQ